MAASMHLGTQSLGEEFTFDVARLLLGTCQSISGPTGPFQNGLLKTTNFLLSRRFPSQRRKWLQRNGEEGTREWSFNLSTQS